MKVNLESDSPDIRIEIIPLIDVIFCILTFFILAAVGLTRQQAINLDLPKASTAVPQLRDMLLVSIDPVGQLYVEKQPVSQDQLYQLLLSYHKTRPDGLIVLNASQLVSYNQVIQVLDLLRSVGGDRVALATQPTNIPTLVTPNANPGPLPLPPLTTPGAIPSPQGPSNSSELPGSGSTLPQTPNPLPTPQTAPAPTIEPVPSQEGTGTAPETGTP